MKIIVLEGKSRRGKTSTMWILRDKLINGGGHSVPQSFILKGSKMNFDDFEETIFYNNQQVTLISMGDYSNILAQRIHHYFNNGSQVLIFTLSNGYKNTPSLKINARNAINTYSPLLPFYQKTVDFNSSSQVRTNEADAIVLQGLI